MCLKNVREWLVSLTMEGYLDRFTDSGYISIKQCQQILYSDLIMLGIENWAHRQLLLDGVQLLQNSKAFEICPEPCNQHNIAADPPILEIEETMSTLIKEHYAALLSPPVVSKKQPIPANVEDKDNSTPIKIHCEVLSPSVVTDQKPRATNNDNLNLDDELFIFTELEYDLFSEFLSFAG